MSAPTTPPRFLRYSLRTLLLLVTAVCLVMGLWVRGALEQKRAVSVIVAHGGEVTYSDEKLYGLNGSVARKPTQCWAPTWLVDWLGRDFFYRVEGVELDGEFAPNAANDETLQAAGQLPRLLSLGIRDAEGRVSDQGLRHLGGLRRLRSLHLRAPQVTAEGTGHLEDLTALQSLVLATEIVGDDGVAWLARLSELSTLRLNCPLLTAEGLEPLTGLRNLTQVVINGKPFGDEHVPPLARIPKLEMLWIHDFAMTGEGLAELSQAPSLRRLRLVSCPNLTHAPLHDAAVVEFSADSCPRLSDAGLKMLPTWRALKFLGFHECPGIGDATLAMAQSLPELEGMDCDGTSTTDEGLAHLGGCANLTHIFLTACPGVTGKTLDQLDKLSRLEWLYLDRSPIDDDGLALLPNLPALDTLSLHETRVSEVGLLRLPELPRLRNLYASGCPLSDEGLQALARRTTLKHLWVSNSQLTPAAIDQFRASRPDRHLTIL